MPAWAIVVMGKDISVVELLKKNATNNFGYHDKN